MNGSLGEMIRRAREARGMKSYELARAIGKQPSYVSDIENGKRGEMLPPDVLAGLSRELGLSQGAMLRAWGYDMPYGDAPEVPLFAEDDPRADIVRLLADINDENAENVLALVRAMWQRRQQLLKAPLLEAEKPRRVS